MVDDDDAVLWYYSNIHMAKKKNQLYHSVEGYNRVAKVYDKKLSYLNSFEKGRIIPFLGEVKGLRILDIGAGTGRIAVQLAQRGAQMTACDNSSKMLDVLKKKDTRIATVVGDAEDLPFKDETFDIVIAAFLIVHLKSLSRFFDEVYRVLKSGGRFLVTNINQRRPPPIEVEERSIIIESFYHRPDSVRAALEESGFVIDKEELVKENGVWINQILLAHK